jgi:hypothetical protein
LISPINKPSFAHLLAVGSVFYLLLTIWALHFPFFWDSILFSKIAHWYLQTNFSNITLPEYLDTGNQPLFPLYLALVWKYIGKTLPISHLMMLPFLIGMLWQYLLLVRRYVPHNQQWFALILLLLQPTLLAQSTMVSMDIPLLFFFLLSINAVISNNNGLLCIGLVLLAAINIRGIYLCGVIAAIQGILQFIHIRKLQWKSFLPYLIPFVVALAWLSYHKSQTGWALQQPNEWAEHRNILGVNGMVRNVVYITQRLFDFGMIALWFFVAGIAFWKVHEHKILLLQEKEMALLVTVPLLGIGLLLLPFSLPIAHRYFMPVQVLLLLPVAYAVQYIISPIKKLLLYASFVLCFTMGHLWIYPAPYANGWEGFITHVRYFPLREEMMEYITTKHLYLTSVGADFPCDAGYQYTNLEHNYSLGSKKISGIHHFQYILYSNINNNFYQWELVELHQHWILEKRMTHYPIVMELYRNPNY